MSGSSARPSTRSAIAAMRKACADIVDSDFRRPFSSERIISRLATCTASIEFGASATTKYSMTGRLTCTSCTALPRRPDSRSRLAGSSSASRTAMISVFRSGSRSA